MKFYAIDPGDKTSGMVLFDSKKNLPEKKWLCENSEIREVLSNDEQPTMDLAIEYTPPYALQMKGSGRAYVPNQVALTAIELGRFVECFHGRHTLVSRIDVKKHLLGRSTGSDADVTQAIYAKYGGTRNSAVGLKKNPGPLYGIKKDMYAALAVAIVYSETMRETEKGGPRKINITLEKPRKGASMDDIYRDIGSDPGYHWNEVTHSEMEEIMPDNQMITVRISKEMHRDLVSAAKAGKKSMNAFCIETLKKAIYEKGASE